MGHKAKKGETSEKWCLMRHFLTYFIPITDELKPNIISYTKASHLYLPVILPAA